MDNLLAAIGIWVVISIPASLFIAHLLSASNPDAKTQRTPLISFRGIATAFDRIKEKLLPQPLIQDDTHPSKNVSH
jgi:hypothetical protein